VRFAFIAAEKAAFPVRLALSSAETVARRVLRVAAAPADAADAGEPPTGPRDRAAIQAESRERYGSPHSRRAEGPRPDGP